MKIFTLNPNCLITLIEGGGSSELLDEANLLNEFSKEISELNNLKFNPSDDSIKKIVGKLSTNSFEITN